MNAARSEKTFLSILKPAYLPMSASKDMPSSPNQTRRPAKRPMLIGTISAGRMRTMDQMSARPYILAMTLPTMVTT